MARRGAHPGAPIDVLVAPAARTANGDTGVLQGYGEVTAARLQLDVTAFAPVAPATAGTLDVVVEDTLDGTTWNVVATFARLTGVGREVLNLTGVFTDRLRVRWTIGTADTTFSVRAYTE